MERFLNLKQLLANIRVDDSTMDEPTQRMFVVEGEHLSANIAVSNGGDSSLHTQPAHDELLVVLEGEADFRVGDEVRRVASGDLVYIPKGAVHGRVRTLTSQWAVLSIYAPLFDRQKQNIVWEKGESDETLSDLAAFAERYGEPTISFDELGRRLKTPSDVGG